MFQCICIITLVCTRLRHPEEDADAWKYVVVCTIYKILLIYICCAFVFVYNKLYKIRVTYIKIVIRDI